MLPFKKTGTHLINGPHKETVLSIVRKKIASEIGQLYTLTSNYPSTGSEFID